MYNSQPKKYPARIRLFFNISRNSCFFQRFLLIHIIAIKEAQLNRRMVGSGHNSHAGYTLPKEWYSRFQGHPIVKSHHRSKQLSSRELQLCRKRNGQPQ